MRLGPNRRLAVEKRLKHCSQILLSAVAVCEFGDAQVDLAGELLRCERALVNNVPRFNIEPMSEFAQRNFASEVSPQLLANV